MADTDEAGDLDAEVKTRDQLAQRWCAEIAAAEKAGNRLDVLPRGRRDGVRAWQAPRVNAGVAVGAWSSV